MGAAAGMMGAVGGGSGILSQVGNMAGAAASYQYYRKVTRPLLKKLGQAEAEEIRRYGRELGAKQVTGYAKAGVRTDVGTPVHVASETASRAELAALRALFSYEHRSWELKQQAGINLMMSLMMLGGSAAQGLSNLQMGGGAQNRSASAFDSIGTRVYGKYRPSMAPGGSEWNSGVSLVYTSDWLNPKGM